MAAMDGSTNLDACAVVGHGTAHATLEQISLLRKDPGPGRPKALEFQILKHADDHTVLGLVAMMQALAKWPSGADFADWGIVAAPRWPGRLGTAHALERYQSDGPRGVSPLAIPNVCLHSLSGTVSLVFGMHGPNFGVGGGLASVADGLLAGLVMQLEQQPPGTWVLFSEWDAEPGQGGHDATTPARALALALAPVEQAPAAPRLCLRPAVLPVSTPAYPRLRTLTDYVLDASPEKMPWSCTFDWGQELVLTEGASKP